MNITSIDAFVISIMMCMLLLLFLAKLAKSLTVFVEDMSFITVPVAANDKVLDELLQSPADKIELIKLILQFVSQQLKVICGTGSTKLVQDIWVQKRWSNLVQGEG